VVIFWDTSAVVPLLVDEERTALATALLRADPDMLVWWGTPVECLSAIASRERETGDREAADLSRRLLVALSEQWSEILASDDVRGHAARLLLRHPLRAADALQLGAALAWADGRPDGHVFATFDERLAEAARREGFASA
jgi:predicted nucleic acid-binding protein